MCGIVGYSRSAETANRETDGRNAVDMLLGGLRKLEYRGYDSSGIAYLGPDNTVVTVKAKGRLAELEKKLDGAPKTSLTGIGHTRWATHGEPSDANSHPHVSGAVTLVHNGIIENYSALKERLMAKGRTFLSETDTEVIAHLIDLYYLGDPAEAVRTAVSRLRGSYALAVMFSDRPGEIYAVRKDSPLVVGRGSDEIIIASDIPAFLSETRDYYLLEENELAVVSDGSAVFYGPGGREIKKELLTASWDIEAAEKCGYPHFMLKEMHEQPKTLRETIFPRITDRGVLAEELGDTSGIRRIYIVGCGSAMHAGLLGKSLIEELSGIPVSVEIASEFRYAPPVFCPGDLIVLISQSGETADSLAVLKLAKERGVKVLAVVNVVGSSIARGADTVIYTNAGPEIAVATTKAYTAQAAVLYMLALRLGIDRKYISGERAVEIRQALLSLPQKVEEVLENEAHYQHLAAVYQDSHDMFFIGRGQDSAVCCEGSLKLKEISYMHSEAYSAGELKHGTISLITEGVPVVAAATTRRLYEKTVSNIKEVRARGADVLFITQFEPEDTGFFNNIIKLPASDEAVMPIIAVVPMQLFAYYTAVARGCDVDKPRNLAKSVTVE